MNVYDLLNLDILEKSKVLAGQSGLQNTVLNTTFIDAPDGYKWCKEGDFIVSTGYPFLNNNNWKEGLFNLLKSLHKKKCSGFGIKLGRYISHLPDNIVNFANKYGFPIISIPDHLSWSEITIPIMSQINLQQQDQLRMTHNVYKRFHTLLKNKGNLDSLSELLSSILSIPVTIYSRDFNILINSKKNLCPKDALKEIISKLNFKMGVNIQKVKWNNHVLNVRWTNTSEGFEGGIFLWGDLGGHDTWKIAAIEQTIIVAALEIEKIRSVSNTIQRFRNNFLTELIEDSNLSYEVLIRKSLEINWNPKEYYNVLILDCIFKSHREMNEFNRLQKKEVILQNIKNNFQDDIFIGLDINNYIVLLIPNNKNMNKVLNRLSSILNTIIGTSFYCGVGGTEKITNLYKSYEEAKVGLKITLDNNRLNKSGIINNVQIRENLNICIFSELSIERVIFSNSPDRELIELSMEVFNKVLEHDNKFNSELLLTLIEFFKNNSKYEDTANSMFIHKNTVRYRIDKIYNLTGLNPDSIKDKFLLYICLMKVNAIKSNGENKP